MKKRRKLRIEKARDRWLVGFLISMGAIENFYSSISTTVIQESFSTNPVNSVSLDNLVKVMAIMFQ